MFIYYTRKVKEYQGQGGGIFFNKLWYNKIDYLDGGSFMKGKQQKADLMLLFIAFAWGLSYLLTDIALVETSPFWLNGIRFIIAFIILFILGRNRLAFPSPKTLFYSLLLGFVLFFVYIGATFGIKYTTLTNAGFLSCITVALVPVFSQFFYGKPVPLKTWVLVLFATIGIALMTLDENFSLKYENLKGDLLCLMCAACYANHLLITEKSLSKNDVDPFQLGTFQMLVCGLLNLAAAFIFEQPSIPSLAPTWISILFLSIFCTAISFIVQPIAQQYTTASHAGVIYTMEPVTAAILAWIFAGEVMNGQNLLGAIILLTSLLIMELGPAIRKKERYKTQ